VSREIKGYLTFTLHSHLPYVLSHGVWPHGADWLNEATAECYIPLLDILYSLEREGIRPAMNIGITPILQEQLKSELFVSQFRSYLAQKKGLALEDERFFRKLGDRRERLARMWYEYYSRIETLFEEAFNADLLSAFARLQDSGSIEIITSAATHGYLPLLGTDNSVYAQIAIGVSTCKRYTGKKPKGIWLPECAYRPRYLWKNPLFESAKGINRRGVEEYLDKAGIKYFIVDSALLMGGRAIGVYLERYEALKRLWQQYERTYKARPEEPRSPYRVHYCTSRGSESKVAFFARDPKTALQVWSGEWGYPGNGVYLDFHKKNWPSGLRYWRVTNPKADLGEKLLYEPENVEGVLFEQSEHFANLCYGILEDFYAKNGIPGIIVAPFDSELFGHWWFEGPLWLKKVLANFFFSPVYSTITASEYMEQFPPVEVIELPEGSWGEGGFHYIWLNEWTRWTWKHIYEAEQTFVRWANELLESPDHNLRRILAQAARELLLLESSDWQFLISTWSARDYAEQRVCVHSEAFKEIISFAEKYNASGSLPDPVWERLSYYEERDKIFPDLDPTLWADKVVGIIG